MNRGNSNGYQKNSQTGQNAIRNVEYEGAAKEKWWYGALLLGVIIAVGVAFLVFSKIQFLGGTGWIPEPENVDPEARILYPIDYLDVRGMLLWFFIFSPVWLLGLWYCETEFRRAYLCAYRYQSLEFWWKKIFGKMLGLIILAFGIFCGALTAFCIWQNDWQWIYALCLCLIGVHSLFLLGIALWLYLVSGNMKLAAGICIFGEGLAKVSVVKKCVAPWQVPFCWGMYHYTVQSYGADGFRILPVIVIQFCVFVSLFFVIYGRGKKLLLRRFGDGKND